MARVAVAAVALVVRGGGGGAHRDEGAAVVEDLPRGDVREGADAAAEEEAEGVLREQRTLDHQLVPGSGEAETPEPWQRAGASA